MYNWPKLIILSEPFAGSWSERIVKQEAHENSIEVDEGEAEA